MSVIAAIAVFPVLTTILFGLAKAETALYGAAALTDTRQPAEPAASGYERGSE